MKKIKILPIIALGALLTATGCQDQSLEDINKNPNDPEKVFSSGLMNSATKELMDATRNGFESGRMSLPWVQYSAQVAYTEEDRFQFRETSTIVINWIIMSVYLNGLTRAMVARQDAAGTSWWSNNIIKADFGEVLMEYSEVQFILSEINGWDDTHYRAGVKASLEKWNVPAGDINTFVNALPELIKQRIKPEMVALYIGNLRKHTQSGEEPDTLIFESKPEIVII
ncbi:hypothetical protein FQR65_LT17853 [Abscondita terminalis]|nr:hypothetical protein FQR65_LT17853 [Abscondita terminalis]